MHSYMAHNGMLATVQARLEQERAQLDAAVNALPGGRAAALEAAAERHAELQAAEGPEITPLGTPAPGTPGGITVTLPSMAPLGGLDSKGATSGASTPSRMDGATSYDAPVAAIGKLTNLTENVELSSASAIHARRRSSAAASALASAPGLRHRSGGKGRKKGKIAEDSLPAPSASLPHGTSLEPSHSTTPHAPRAPHPLAWHPDENVALLARNIDAMADELKSNGKKGLVWPENVTYWHFADFMIIPTLVYQLEYPRTNRYVRSVCMYGRRDKREMGTDGI
jgi:sterol O-acyltransferase